MDRAGVGTAMLMLTALSVIAPAAEWVVGSNSTDRTSPPPAPISSSPPTRSSQELRLALDLSRDTSAGVYAGHSSPRPLNPHLRDPFAQGPLIAATAQPAVLPAPAIELLGIIETPDGGVATISIDGSIASLRIGESAGNVKLERIGLPDSAVVTVGGIKMTVRVQ